MKAFCMMDSVSRANGGLFEAERKLQQHLQADEKVEVSVIGLKDTFTEDDHGAWFPLQPRTWPVTGPQALGFAPGLNEALTATGADIGYLAGLWKYPSVAAQGWADRHRKPLVIAPHGMLDVWALRNSAWKKRIAGWVFQNAQLRRAACLRALCAAEVESFRAYGLRGPVCVVPNGIDLEDLATPTARPSDLLPADKKLLLYLGRLHPKKGLEHLVSAWSQAKASTRDWILVIAGWDQGGHEAALKRQATDLGLHWRDQGTARSADASLIFAGPHFGEAKKAIYRACDAFILPSFSEGLPMVVLEAWAQAKPVLMTPQCNIPEGFTDEAALQVEAESASIRRALEVLVEMSDADRCAMGRRGRNLVERSFAWPKVARQMGAVYAWLLGGGPSPACVQAAARGR